MASHGVNVSDATVRGVTVDSADVGKEEIFVAIAGAKTHGAQFAADAIAAGASAIVTDTAGAQIVGDADVPVAVVPDPRALAGELAKVVYDDPCSKLKVFTVTGTNGKTTTSCLLRAVLQSLGYPTAMIGTIDIATPNMTVAAVHTTTEAPLTLRVFAKAIEEGARAAVIETSSHALALHRTAGLHFDVSGFLNLQHDHLDFHKTMEGYFAAKAKLFTPALTDQAVICVDDEWGQKLTEIATVPFVTSSGKGKEADYSGKATQLEVGHTRFSLTHGGKVFPVELPYTGEVNVQNATLAVAMVAAAGLPLTDAIAAIAHADQVPGRMHFLPKMPGVPVCGVDFAHTPDALEALLTTLRPLTRGAVHLVFGSDGDRDASKRPILGEIAARLADYLWVTDENPRSEDPGSIRHQIMVGVKQVRPDLHQVTEVTTCRRDALRYATLAAKPGDIVFVTGKGVEPFQEIQGVFHRYSDLEVLAECMRAYAHHGASRVSAS